MQKIQVIVLVDKTILLGQIDEVSSEMGEPDCKLINPYVVLDDDTLTPWLSKYTNQNIFMIHSDKILTISEPNGKMITNYEEILKG